MPYKVKLPIFEGPFDLLLYLIKKNEVDVYDIPIAEITRQYLEYLELMKMLDLDVAGEFIEMVATLMLIKVRMLLPQPEPLDEEEPEDPRAALVAQLLEYRRFKEATVPLAQRERERRQYFPRAVPERLKNTVTEEEPLQDATLFDLISAFKTALDNMPKVTVHQVNVIKVTLDQQVAFLIDRLKGKPYALFSEVVKPLRTRMELVVTFMAILDLMRLHLLSAKQSEAFGEIRLVPLKDCSYECYLKVREQDILSAEELENNHRPNPENVSHSRKNIHDREN